MSGLPKGSQSFRILRARGFRRVRYRTACDVIVLPGHLIAAKEGRKAFLVHRLIGITIRLRSDSGMTNQATHRLEVEAIGRSALKEPSAVIHWVVWDKPPKKRIARRYGASGNK